MSWHSSVDLRWSTSPTCTWFTHWATAVYHSERRSAAGRGLFGVEAQEADSQDTKEKSNEQEMTFDRLGQI